MPVLLIPILFAAGVAAGKISLEREEKKRKEEEERRCQAQLRAEQQSMQREQIRLRRLREDQEKEEADRRRREWEEQIEKERIEKEARAAEAEAEMVRVQKEKEDWGRKQKEREKGEAGEKLRKGRGDAERRRQATTAKQQAHEAAAQKRTEDAAGQRILDAQQAECDDLQKLLHGIPPDIRPSPEVLIRVREQYAYQSNKLNIAIVGQSGVGKSSLLNAFRTAKPTDPMYAPTGINETTAMVKAYPDPRRRNVVWYDVPGADTPDVKGWDYFVARGAYAFDALVVVFGARFTMTATTLIKNAKECNIPVFLVRTMVDQLVEAVITDEEVDEEEAREIVRLSTRKLVDATLKKVGLPGRNVYLVEKDKLAELVKVTDEWAQTRFDESALMKDLLSMRGIHDDVEEDDDFELL